MPDDSASITRRRLTEDAPSPPSVYLDVPSMPWEDTAFPGIRMKLLCSDPASGLCTMLMRLEPGAVVPLHEHTAIEQTWVFEGALQDDEGSCGPGQFVWRPAGNTHTAWAGPEGALILGVFLKPNIFANGTPFFTAGR